MLRREVMPPRDSELAVYARAELARRQRNIAQERRAVTTIVVCSVVALVLEVLRWI